MVCQLEVISKLNGYNQTNKKQNKKLKKFVFCWEQQHVINVEDCSYFFKNYLNKHWS